MDKRPPPKSKRQGKGQPATQRKGIPFGLVHFLLGLVLIVAGALKLYELAYESSDESTPALFLIFLAEFELLGGIWMAAWIDPERTRWWAAAVFLGLACSSLFEALAGKCSCGCFGSLSVSPWFILVFDLAAVAALLGSRPSASSQISPFDQPWRFLGLGILALIIGIAGWMQADLVTVAGTVTADGRPLKKVMLTFTGESGKIVLRTDHDGHFRLPPLRPGLYAVSAPGRAPINKPKTEPPVRKPVRKDARRSKEDTPQFFQPDGGAAVLWVEVAACSEYNKAIEL
jgi:hypothetical protein